MQVHDCVSELGAKLKQENNTQSTQSYKYQ
jgi:hypothetical protein